MIKIILLAVFMVLSSGLHAEFYSLDTPNYSVAYGAYSTNDHISLSFLTLNSIPNNPGNIDFKDQVVSYTIHDGIQTLTEQNSEILFFYIALSNGQINGTGITIWRAPITTASDGNVSGVDIYQGATESYIVGFLDGVCSENSGPGGRCTSAASTSTNSGNYLFQDFIYRNGFEF